MSFHLAALALLFLGFILAAYLAYRYRRLYREERSRKSSLATRHGMKMEQLMPLAEDFPGDPGDFRFLGNPVDGVLFGDEEITFMEFKTGSSGLTPAQKRIREQVKKGRVSWEEMRS